jgi:hypothetical protein
MFWDCKAALTCFCLAMHDNPFFRDMFQDYKYTDTKIDALYNLATTRRGLNHLAQSLVPQI